MDIESGRIYDLKELYPTAQDRLEMERRVDDELEAAAASLTEEQRAYEEGVRAGRVVPVSESVRRQQLAGQRVEDRRRKRKAAKAARKANRG